MSEQEQETPVWHAIVGEGWEPVQIGQLTERKDQVLLARGWADQPVANTGLMYGPDMRPRRRLKRSYDISSHIDGTTYGRIKAAKPGDRFVLTQNGELVPIEVDA